MPVEAIYSVGWGVAAQVNTGTQVLDVLSTGGELSVQQTPVFITMAEVGNIDSGASRMRVITADGTFIKQGNVNFDCDNETLPTFITWVFGQRKTAFSVCVGTQNFEYIKLDNCYWNSVALNGSAQGLVTGNISFVSNDPNNDFLTSGSGGTSIIAPLNTRTLVPYWQTGNSDVTSWSLTVNQTVTPQYLNTVSALPKYFRIENWQVDITAETLVRINTSEEVRLCLNRLFSPITGFRLTQTGTKGGHTDPARYSYSYSTHAEPTSFDSDAWTYGEGQVFTVTST